MQINNVQSLLVFLLHKF